MSNLAPYDPRRLPYGNIGFADMRERQKIYVDKTDLLYQIAIQDVPIFFSRPRRFGKSLLINTLASLFADGLKYFKGLAIEKMWNDKTYQVIRLDFSSLADKPPQDFKRGLGDKLITKFNVEGRVSKNDENGIRDPDIILAQILEKSLNNSIVLLIDEYDAPLTHNIDKEDNLNSIMMALNSFYATIKEYTDKFRLIFITGVTRISHISIFSAFNNLNDLSLSPEFNSLLGFTQNDLVHYFDPYVEHATQILNMSKDDIYARIQQYYDGFQFTLDAEETLYNPWSIINFLYKQQAGFRNYWFKSSGSSTIIMQYLKDSSFFQSFSYTDNDICISEDELSDRHEISNIPRDLLLYQTGYLTIRQTSDDTARLVFPNTEVEDSILKLSLLAHNLRPDQKYSAEIDKLPVYIDKRNLEEIVNLFNNIINDCVSILSNIFNDERSVRDIIYAALPQKMKLQKIKERETCRGRSDLELLTRKTHMIIEFKRTQSNRGKHASLEEAKAQIKSKQYGLSPFQTYNLYRVAMVISSEEKKILYDFCEEI
ncbi:MAG: AAA family ATPase [Desulfovibrionaceae bacterium]|nr:AAA family ATPase [Desulfovibrionaceae bacterium]